LTNSGSVLEVSGASSVRQGDSFWPLLTEATPVALLLPKPCHVNPTHLVFTVSHQLPYFFVNEKAMMYQQIKCIPTLKHISNTRNLKYKKHV